MHRSKRSKSVSGLSLIEVLIAAVVGSLVLMGLVQLLSSVLKTGKQVSSKLDFDNSGALITRLLRNPANCGTYFNNQTFLSAPGGLGSQVIGAGGNLSIHMPGDPTNIIAQPGIPLVNTVTTQSLVIRDIVFQSTDNYHANVHIVAIDSAAPRGLPLTREFPIALTTEDVTSPGPPQKRIRACSGSGETEGSGGSTRVIARHSFTTSAPDCPTDWDSLWTGYSFAGATGDMRYNNHDLGTSGSCLEVFNPTPVLRCADETSGVVNCDYAKGTSMAMWLTTTGPTNESTVEGVASVLPKVSRCRVCSGSYSLVVRHSLSSTVPSCPTGWTALWTGYSFGGMTSEGGGAEVRNLDSPGSCLEEFKPKPFIECNTLFSDPDKCEFSTPGDYSVWLSIDEDPTSESGPWTGNTLRNNHVSRCSVCYK